MRYNDRGKQKTLYLEHPNKVESQGRLPEEVSLEVSHNAN